MMKKAITILFSAALMLTLFTACAPKKTEEAATGTAGTYIDFIDSGKIFAAQIGDVYGAVAKDIFVAAQVQEFTLAPDMLEAVRLGKVDAAVLDDAYVKQIQDSGQYPDLDYIPVPKEVFANMASNVFHTEGLRDQFNQWFETILADGTFDEIYGRWIGVSLPKETDIPRFELTGENGTLRVCNTGNFPPFSYVDSKNQPVGFDEEILSRFAAHLGMDIEYNMMAYDAIIPYVLSGKADMSGCSFTLTDERESGVIFGTTYAKAKAVLVIKKSDSPSAAKDYTAFAGKRIGAQTGEIYVLVAQDILLAGEVPEYPTITDLLESLNMGRTDAVITDSSYIEPLIDSGAYPNFDYVWVPKDVYSNESAVVLHTEELRAAFNKWLAGILSDGTMAEMEQRWLGGSLPKEEDIPKFTLTGENGVLRVCDTGDYPPFSYFDSNGDYCGMDYELISRFAEHMGMTLDVTMMTYDAIAPYVRSGKADMSACYLTISEERGQSMIFSDPIVSTQGVLIVPKTNEAAGAAAPRDYTAFEGKDIAAMTGALTVNTTEKIGGQPIEYNDSASAAEDVRLGRVAGYLHALTAVQVMASQMDGFEVIPVPKEVFAAQVGGISHDQAVIDRFNVFLTAMEADGTLSEMKDRWFSDKLNLDAPIPPIANSGANGVLEVAICSDAIPYVFSGSGGAYSGFSVELALRFGAYEGKTVKFTDMEFGGLIPYIVSQRAELALANMAITEERKQSVLFTAPFFDEQHGILTRKQDTPANSTSPLHYTNFFGQNIGTKTGGMWDAVMEEHLAAAVSFYNDLPTGIESLRKGIIDGFVTDYSNAMLYVATEGSGELVAVQVPPEIYSAPMGAISMDQTVIDRFDAFLAEIKADGTFDEIQSRWLDTVPDLESAMPDIPLESINGTLKVAVNADALPFSYVGAGGVMKGYSVELVRRFAAHEGMDIAFFEMEFGGLLPFVVSGKADLAIGDITITEERKKSVLFTDSIYEDCGGIIALKPVAAGGSSEYKSLAGKNIGVLTGSFFDVVTKEGLNANPIYYQETTAAVEDVRKGRIDGVMYDYTIGSVILNQQSNDVFALIDIPHEIHSGPMGAISADQDVIDRFNAFLAVIEADGTLADTKRRWLEESPGSDPPMPDITSTGENGILTVATTAMTMPFSYRGADNQLKGFDIELALRFGAYEGKTVEFVTMAFEGLIPCILAGKADLSIDAIAITEERKQSVLFSEPYYYDHVVVMVLKQAVDAKEGGDGFGAWLKSGIERNLITDNRWKMIVSGLGVTMVIAVLAQIFGTAFGAFVCWLLTRKNRFVRGIGTLYCGLIYGTPIVVLLMITYYIIFGSTSVSNVLVAVFAFTMITGASVATNLKGAIETVDTVEIEAARSIGFSAFKAFRAVTLPQAVRRALPGYTNGFVELVKATAIVGYIAIQDLTRAGDIIRSRTYDAYFPLLFVAVIYLIVTTLCVQIFKLIVKRINSNTATPRSKGKTALDWRAMRQATGGDQMDAGQTERGDNE